MKPSQDEYEFLLYVTDAGRTPFEDWLRGVKGPATRQRVFARIDRLRLGNFGDCRGVGGGVSELRIHHGPGLRVYFSVTGPKQVTLLCAGDKATQAKDIERAVRFRRELMRDAN